MNINEIKELLTQKAAEVKVTIPPHDQNNKDAAPVAPPATEDKPKSKRSRGKKAEVNSDKQVAVVPSDNNIEAVVAKLLKPGIDYGMVPGCKKPSLLKAGAEKLAVHYGLRSEVEITNRIQLLEKNFISYEVRVTLRNDQGFIVSQGVGCCNNGEKKYTSSSLADVINTVIKMAKKRAFVDAVLTAAGASGLFTQDMEDIANYAADSKLEAIG